MKQIFDSLYHFGHKIGRRNVVLILFVISVVVISGLYTTFSLSTYSGGITVVDGIKTLKFILGNDDEENSLMIAAGSSKNIAITVSNQEDIKLKYGIYYSSLDDLEDVEIGYYHSTEYLPNGIIEPHQDYVVTLQIVNHTDEIKNISFGLVYGLEAGGELVIEENQHFLEEMWNFSLSDVSSGSYVQYVGSNGCEEEQCKGKNANDVDNTIGGYCGDDKTSFNNSGWRVAYTRNNSAYLISAGSPYCMNQEKDEKISDFIKRINDEALSFCNLDYAFGGVCDEKNTWVINDSDFYHITGSKLNQSFCLERSKDENCGYKNDLLDIGSYYWVNTIFNNQMLYYYPDSFYYTVQLSDVSKGIRPILKLADSVIVIKGSGKIDDPYVIKNTNVADYEYTVVYNGNGATSGDVKDSVHKTNVLNKLNKNEFKLSYRVKLSDVAYFDDSYCDDSGSCYPSSVSNELEKSAKFLGWSTNMDDKEAIYMDEQEVMNLSTSSEEIIVNLYAIWQYDAFVLPEIQARDGYEILGWYTARDGGDKVGNPGDEYTGNNKVTLYAKWQKK